MILSKKSLALIYQDYLALFPGPDIWRCKRAAIPNIKMPYCSHLLVTFLLLATNYQVSSKSMASMKKLNGIIEKATMLKDPLMDEFLKQNYDLKWNIPILKIGGMSTQQSLDIMVKHAHYSSNFDSEKIARIFQELSLFNELFEKETEINAEFELKTRAQINNDLEALRQQEDVEGYQQLYIKSIKSLLRIVTSQYKWDGKKFNLHDSFKKNLVDF